MLEMMVMVPIMATDANIGGVSFACGCGSANGCGSGGSCGCGSENGGGDGDCGGLTTATIGEN